MSFNPETPYNDLPVLPPNTEIENRQVLKRAIAAHQTLAELKGFCATLPDESMLLNSVVLKEAQASSEIENIITTQDALYRALAVKAENAAPETKEVLSYRKAMWSGMKLLETKGLLTINDIIAIQQEIVGNTAGIRTMPGTVLRNDATQRTIYTPPDEESTIRQLLGNLQTYWNTSDSTDPLVKMAVSHYQFESIHPFYDGNGRTGRILNVLYLVKERLLPSPVLYLSEYIIDRKGRYYSLLQQVRTDANWRDWVLFMLDAVEATARRTLSLIDAILRLLEETLEQAKASLPKTSYSKELIETIFNQPYTKIEHVVDRGLAERRTASKYLQQLEDAGILESFKAWKETIYVNRRLFDLLKE